MPSPFHRLPDVTPDPIFALLAEARAAGKDGIDVSIGMMLDDEARPILLPSVQQAVNELAQDLMHERFGYAPLTGSPSFRDTVRHLAVGDAHKHVCCAATVGGTGAVAVALHLVKKMSGDATLVLPVPAWGNYPTLAEGAGLPLQRVPYLEDGLPSARGCIEALEQSRAPVALMLQAGCHNPTGLDFTREQWEEVFAAMAAHDAIAVIDMAYQGFGEGPEQDALPVRLAAEKGVAALIAWSGAKNHSLYSERAGALLALCPDAESVQRTERHIGRILRSMHSCAALFGQSVVTHVQERYREEWLRDLADMRAVLRQKRERLMEGLPESFAHSLDGRGMFAALPLTPEQIAALKRAKVFLTDEGRINIAGIPDARIDELLARITAAIA